MVSRCFNPACAVPFRSLEEGTLFRLEPDGTYESYTLEPEYFWLCDSCEAAMTLTLRDDGVVAIAHGQSPQPHGGRRDMPMAIHSRKGPLLRAVSFLPRP